MDLPEPPSFNMRNYEQFVARIGRRRTAQRRGVLAAWLASGGAILAGLGGLGTMGIAAFALVGATVGVIAVRPLDRRRVADEIDRRLSLPQTVGTALRCGGGPGDVIAAAADAAVEGQQMATFAMPAGRFLAWMASPVLSVGLLMGLSSHLSGGRDGSPNEAIAFKNAGDVIGAPTTPTLTLTARPAVSQEGREATQPARGKSSRQSSASASTRSPSAGDAKADEGETAGAGMAQSSGDIIEPTEEVRAPLATAAEPNGDATATPGDGAAVAAASDTPASAGGRVEVERDEISDAAARRAAVNPAGTPIDRNRRVPPAYRDLIRAFFSEPNAASN